MNSSLLNLMESTNEFFVLFFAEYLFVFTDLIPDMERRNFQGKLFTYVLVAIICFNCLLLLVSIAQKIIRMIDLY